MFIKPNLRNDDMYLQLSDALNTGVVMPSNPQLQYEAGFRLPVVYSPACHARHIEWKSPDRSQDETGREWDVLMLSAMAIRLGANDAGQAESGIYSVPPGQTVPVRDDLRVVWLGDEDDDPVVLIMLATETVRGINLAVGIMRNVGGVSHV